ncbi:hypothetical protein N8550_03440 [Pirellulaceae bacterium]|nr:hypothetical protein [Pirellulaceae bacterium]
MKPWGNEADIAANNNGRKVHLIADWGAPQWGDPASTYGQTEILNSQKHSLPPAASQIKFIPDKEELRNFRSAVGTSNRSARFVRARPF